MLFSQVIKTSISHSLSAAYLIDPYMSSSYGASNISASLRSQVAKVIQKVLHSQVTRALYNVNRLRIMKDFPSRGITGANWTYITGASVAGDFAINNVNDDFVEHAMRTTGTTITIQCDSEVSQGLFVDTFAMLAHNLTRSAVVTFAGSNSSVFATIPFSVVLNTELENMYYIAPILPNDSYRYWRLIISDTTNTDGYIQIGTIIFGNAIIFSGECITDEVEKKKVHFKDGIRTEAFTTISNNRALKNIITFNIRQLDFSKNNYGNLMEVVDTVRTSLKALWILDPRMPSRFAPFGKLTEMPVEKHNVLAVDADYIDMTITVDESL